MKKLLILLIPLLAGLTLLTGTHGASAAIIRGAETLTAGQSTCIGNPPVLLNAGGAAVTVQPGSYKFEGVKASEATWDDPYVTIGYNTSLNSGWYCDDGKTWQPPKYGAQGNPRVSSHYITGSTYNGDVGLDIWYSPKGVTTYTGMANGGANTTEIMVWDSHPGVGTQSTSFRYYPVEIGGHRWQVQVGLVAYGHGRTDGRKGWNVVNFIAPSTHKGNVSVNKLALNPLIQYAAAHGWLNKSDYLQAVDDGGEMRAGSFKLTGYLVTGLN